MNAVHNAMTARLDVAPAQPAPLPIFHWAFFRLEVGDGQLQLAKRRDMRVFVVASAIVVYLLFLLVAMEFMAGFERIFTMAVCCCAPAVVYLVTATFGLQAQILEGSIAQANQQLAEAVRSGDNRNGLAVLQVAASFGRSEALETVTFLVRSYQARPVVDARAFVELAQLCARDQIIVALTGSARSFQPLLQLSSSWRTPVPLIGHVGRVRIEAPFTLL